MLAPRPLILTFTLKVESSHFECFPVSVNSRSHPSFGARGERWLLFEKTRFKILCGWSDYLPPPPLPPSTPVRRPSLCSPCHTLPPPSALLPRVHASISLPLSPIPPNARTGTIRRGVYFPSGHTGLGLRIFSLADTGYPCASARLLRRKLR